jgi:transposase
MPARRSRDANGTFSLSQRTRSRRRTCTSPVDPKCFPWLRHVFADGGYAGPKLKKALASIGRWTIEIVRRSDAAKGFKLLPRRWVVERTIAWLNRNRRLEKDFEATIASAEAWLIDRQRQVALAQTRQSLIRPGYI